MKLNSLSKHTWLLFIPLLTFFLQACTPVNKEFEPTLVYTPNPLEIQDLPSAFSPLSCEELAQDWAKELKLGDAFARQLDLYRALTCYKRARILLPEEAIERQIQIDYNIILCYYLGQKYQEAVNVFEESLLINVNPLFPAYNNLVIILHDSYSRLGHEEKCNSIFEAIEKCSPETAQNINLSSAIKQRDYCEIESFACGHPCKDTVFSSLDYYNEHALSPSRARTLNAILPGAGYYYVGQKKSAVTSFIINALFTLAAYQFFSRGYYAAGIITTSLETGWYFGGINGAGLEAEEFNLRLYENTARNVMIKCKLFPVLMFKTAF